MAKISDWWNSNWPNYFMNGEWTQFKGQIIKNIWDLEVQIENKDKELISLKEKVAKLENTSLKKVRYHKCEFWCVKCGFEVIPNQTGILNANEDCHYCFQCKEIKMKEFLNNNWEISQLEKIQNLEKRLAKIEVNEEIENSSVETVTDYSLGWKIIDSKGNK